MAAKQQRAKIDPDLKGKAAVLKRKGEYRGQNGLVGEVNDSHVAFHFDSGAVLYVPHEEIESLEAGRVKEEPEPEPEAKPAAFFHLGGSATSTGDKEEGRDAGKPVLQPKKGEPW